MGHTPAVRLLSSAVFVVVAACGGGGDDGGFGPPGGSDAGPRPDAGPDAPADASMADARLDGPLAGVPPVITLVSPSPDAIVRGTVRVEVDVVDADGIMDVRGSVGSLSFTFTRITAGQPAFQGFLDTVPLAGTVSPTFIVRATDTVGDSAQLGFQLVLDNFPPIAALDPPNVRIADSFAVQTTCSNDFDPLGPDAPNDGEAVPQLFELRARIADVGNTGTLNSSLYIPNAGVMSAQVYVFDDTTKPLVVDTNADGFCDAINPTIVPATVPMLANEAAVVMLSAITPTGAASYGGATFGGTNAASCLPPTTPTSPDPLCSAEPEATIVLDTPFTNQTEIYGMPPVSTFNCLGFAFDARASRISDGWACAAVVTTDALGNRSVSAPLRICVDSDGNRAECAAWGTIASTGLPSCTGTVTAGVVSNTACTPRAFPRSSTANEFELVRP